PTSVTTVVNSPATSTIMITPVNGFTGGVALTSDNAVCSLTPPTVTSGSGTSTLSCTFTSTGTVTVTVTGTSGSLSHSATVDFIVTALPDFTISANPTIVTIAVNSPGTSMITISPLNGFTGDVAITSDNAACTLTPATVTGGSGTSTLSCTFTVAGSVTVTVTGASGSLTHTATVDFTVTSIADFSVSANPTSVSVLVGATGTSTITITPLNGFTGDVALVVDNVACSLTPATVTGGSGTSTLSCVFGAAGFVTVTVSGTSGPLSNTATVGFIVTPPSLDDTSTTVWCAASLTAGTTGSCSVTVADTTTPANTPFVTASLTSSDVTVGTVDASCTLSGGSCTATNPSHTYSVAGGFTVKLTVTDSSSPALSQSASHNVVVSPVSGQRDFTISASPTSVTVTGESPLCEGSSTLCDDEAMTTLTL